MSSTRPYPLTYSPPTFLEPVNCRRCLQVQSTGRRAGRSQPTDQQCSEWEPDAMSNLDTSVYNDARWSFAKATEAMGALV